MLQPNQPMGVPNQAATGPQAPKPGMPPMSGQKQMPAGQMLSGVAGGGLGSILDSVARPYAGNPQALEQKGMGGDLLAALAAQRLKSQKEHALQQLQLQAAGQQAPEQQKTVVEQNEDALMELTKQEMQAEQMDTLQQKQGQMQAGQKRLMQAAMNPQDQGLGGMPAPNAAEPKAMASGGIIAFDDGGGVDAAGTDTSYTPSGSGLGALDPRQYLRSQSPEEQARINELLEKYRGRIQYKQARDIAEGRMTEDELNRPVATTQPGAQPGARQAVPEDTGGPQPGARKPTPAPNAADVRPAAPPQGVENLLGQATNRVLQTDPQAEAEKARTSSYEFMKPSDEDVAKRREQLAGVEALNKKYFDPDQQQIRELIRTMAVGPSSFAASTMGQLGRNAAASGEAEYRQQRAALLGEEKGLAGLMGDIYAPKKEAVETGEKAGSTAASLLAHGLSSATSRYVGELQAAAQRDATAATREGLNFQRLTSTLANVTDKREKARQKVLEGYTMNPDFALFNKDPSKLSSSEQSRIAGLKTKIDTDMKAALGGFDSIISSLEGKLGYTGGASSGAGAGAVPFSALPK